MTNPEKFGPEFNCLPDTSTLHSIELTNTATNNKLIIKNEPGKQATIKIYCAISRKNNMEITSVQAKHGLELYGDYVLQEQQQPNSHPNIRILLDTIALEQVWTVKIN